MKHPNQTKPNISFGTSIRFLLLMLILFSTQFVFSQPPPQNPPDGLTDNPFDNPVVIKETDPEGTIRFETINNTNCSAEFANWFHIGLRNKSTGNLEEIYFKELPYILPGGQSGTLTNYQLFSIFQLPAINEETHEYVILSTGVYIKFGNMSGFIPLLPNASGTTILAPGNDPPCDCFIFYIVSTGSKITLTLDPCP